MKKILSAVLCVAMGAMLSLGVAGCSGSGGNDINPDADTTLKVSVYAAGYGTGWIEEACRIYSEDHPEVGFTIEANNRMFDTIKTRLETGTCDSDIVLIANANYSSLVALGVLEELSGVYNAVIPGTEGTTVRSVIPDIQYNYRVRNGGVYGVPWQDATPPGFIYNKTLFKEHGWNESPDTMTEFFELCDEIAKTDVAPLVYGGGQENGYAVNILNQWFVEYYGYDYIANTFMDYASPDIYSYTLEGRQKVYETAARLLQGQTANGESIALAGGSVPAGRYTRQALINRGMLPETDDPASITTEQVSEALGGVEISEQDNVSKVLAAVVEGSCEVGTTYYSDTYGYEDDLDILQAVSYDLTGNVTYPIARVVNEEADEAQSAAADDFLAFILSDEAGAVFESYYFDTDVE